MFLHALYMIAVLDWLFLHIGWGVGQHSEGQGHCMAMDFQLSGLCLLANIIRGVFQRCSLHYSTILYCMNEASNQALEIS